MRRPLPEISRARWHEHPAWARQAYAALVSFHDRYRRETARLVAAAPDERVGREDLRRDCLTLEEHLRTHEAVEEQGLYPFIESRFDVDLEPLRQEHDALNACIDTLHALIERADRHAIRAQLVRLDETLRAHLAAEEALCVPALLSTSEADFHALAGD